MACKGLIDVMPTDFTVLDTDDYIFWNVDLKAEEGQQVTMVVVLNKNPSKQRL